MLLYFSEWLSFQLVTKCPCVISQKYVEKKNVQHVLLDDECLFQSDMFGTKKIISLYFSSKVRLP